MVGVSAALQGPVSPLDGGGDDPAHVLAGPRRGAAKSLAGACRKCASLFCSRPCEAAGLVHGDPLTAKAFAVREESFASVALPHQSFVLLPQLVPERVEFRIVWPVDNVGELVEHGVCHLLSGEEQGTVAGVSQPKEDLLSSVHI